MIDGAENYRAMMDAGGLASGLENHRADVLSSALSDLLDALDAVDADWSRGPISRMLHAREAARKVLNENQE